MCVEIKQNIPVEEIYRYMERLDFPTQYYPDFGRWEDSFLRDVDGEGRALFSDLTAAGAYTAGALTGFIQYGRTAFGFDGSGAVDTASMNTTAQRFYEKTGFVRLGVTRSYVRVDRQEK